MEIFYGIHEIAGKDFSGWLIKSIAAIANELKDA